MEHEKTDFSPVYKSRWRRHLLTEQGHCNRLAVELLGDIYFLYLYDQDGKKGEKTSWPTNFKYLTDNYNATRTQLMLAFRVLEKVGVAGRSWPLGKLNGHAKEFNVWIDPVRLREISKPPRTRKEIEQ